MVTTLVDHVSPISDLPRVGLLPPISGAEQSSAREHEKVTHYKLRSRKTHNFKTCETHVPPGKTLRQMSGQNEFLKLSYKALNNRVYNENIKQKNSQEPLQYRKFNMSPCFTGFYWHRRKLKHLTSFTSPNCFPPRKCGAICGAISFINILFIVTRLNTYTFSASHLRFPSQH